MIKTKSYAALSATTPLQPLTIDRRDPNPDDVVIQISHCGICHSDIHTVRSEWGPAVYPCVPGHEIVGQVIQVGKKVKKFKVGDNAGVGCFVDSCGKCSNCKKMKNNFVRKKQFSLITAQNLMVKLRRKVVTPVTSLLKISTF
jgi:uncharacterized zinc-type alcohol dehydrogenase-like protein